MAHHHDKIKHAVQSFVVPHHSTFGVVNEGGDLSQPISSRHGYHEHAISQTYQLNTSDVD
jgi:hypothetical protein